jgi:hypothetical protein
MHIVFKLDSSHVTLIRICEDESAYNAFMVEKKRAFSKHQNYLRLKGALRSRLYNEARQDMLKARPGLEPVPDLASYKVAYRTARDAGRTKEAQMALEELNRMVNTRSQVINRNNLIQSQFKMDESFLRNLADSKAKNLSPDECYAYNYNEKMEDPTGFKVIEGEVGVDINKAINYYSMTDESWDGVVRGSYDDDSDSSFDEDD